MGGLLEGEDGSLLGLFETRALSGKSATPSKHASLLRKCAGGKRSKEK